MQGAKGFVVARIDLDDAFRVSLQFLDVDAGAETPAFGAHDDDAHGIVGVQAVDFFAERPPADRVQGVDRRILDDELGDACVDGRPELPRHEALRFLVFGPA